MKRLGAGAFQRLIGGVGKKRPERAFHVAFLHDRVQQAAYLLIPVGFASGEVPQIPANILLVKNLTVIGLYWGAYWRFKPEVIAESFRTLIGWFEQGRIRPHVSNVVPLPEAGRALDLLETRQATGKVVVTP